MSFPGSTHLCIKNNCKTKICRICLLHFRQIFFILFFPLKKETAPRRKAKLTLNILVTILRGAGRLTKAVFGSLRVTKIRVCLGVRGEDPAEAARAYGRLNAWLYSSLGVIDRFVYLDFDELRILPDFGSAEPTVADRVSFRLSARLLFIVAAALRVLYEFWHEKVLDVFL